MSSSSKKEGKSSQKERGVKRKQDEERNAGIQTEEEYKSKRIRLLVESDQSKKEIEVTMKVMETKTKEREPTESQGTTSNASEKRKYVEEDNGNDNEKEDQPKGKKSKKPVITPIKTTTATLTESTELSVIRLTTNELYNVLINGLRDNTNDDEEGMIKETENPPIDAATTITDTTNDTTIDIDDVATPNSTPGEESEYHDTSDVEEIKHEEAPNVEKVNPQNIDRKNDSLQDDTDDRNKTFPETSTSTTELPPLTNNTIIPTITITDTTTTDATNIQPKYTIQEAKKETLVFKNSLRVESSTDGSRSATRVQKKLPHSTNNGIIPVTTATSTSDKALDGTEVSNSPAFTTINRLHPARSTGRFGFRRLSNAAPTDFIRSPSNITAIGGTKSLYATTVDFTTRPSNTTHVDSIRTPSDNTTIDSIRRQADITPISTRPSDFTTVRNERPSNTTPINDIFGSALSNTPTGRRTAITEEELRNLNYFEKDSKRLRKEVKKEKEK